MRGKDFELECDRFLNKQRDIYIVKRIEGGFTNMQGSESRFTPKKGIDRWLLSSKYQNVALEIKYTDSERFPFSRLTPHQLKILSDFEDSECGLSFILLGFQNGATTLLFSLYSYQKMVETKILMGRQSINIRLDKSFILGYSVEVNRSLIKSNYMINLEKMLVER